MKAICMKESHITFPWDPHIGENIQFQQLNELVFNARHKDSSTNNLVLILRNSDRIQMEFRI